MKVTDAFEGNFIDALALTDGKVTLTIKSYAKPNEVKAKDSRPIDKPVLYFEKTDKGLILNKTNAKAIGLVLGNEMDNWEGHKVTLFRDQCEAFGIKNTPCVRARVERGAK